MARQKTKTTRLFHSKSLAGYSEHYLGEKEKAGTLISPNPRIALHEAGMALAWRDRQKHDNKVVGTPENMVILTWLENQLDTPLSKEIITSLATKLKNRCDALKKHGKTLNDATDEDLTTVLSIDELTQGVKTYDTKRQIKDLHVPLQCLFFPKSKHATKNVFAEVDTTNGIKVVWNRSTVGDVIGTGQFIDASIQGRLANVTGRQNNRLKIIAAIRERLQKRAAADKRKNPRCSYPIGELLESCGANLKTKNASRLITYFFDAVDQINSEGQFILAVRLNAYDNTPPKIKVSRETLKGDRKGFAKLKNGLLIVDYA